MSKVTFITWNQGKADYLSKYLGYPIEHLKLDLDEIQSMDLKEIVTHKVYQAYEKIKTPVIVEDGSLEFLALWWLPWPFIKFFIDNTSFEVICSMINEKLTRKAIARIMIGYFDGTELKLFESNLNWEIPRIPAWEKGYGWDKIFIPEWYDVTRASLNEKDYKETYLKLKPFGKLKEYLEGKYG